jgi:hypothetical protein
MSAAAAASRREVARYAFFDRDGVHLFDEVKYDPKSFALCRPSGVAAAGTGALPPGGIVWGLNAGYYLCNNCALEWKAARDGGPGVIWLEDCPRVLFNLPAVLAATDIIVCEGAKDAQAANDLGFTATTNPQGAGQWKKEYSENLRGKNVAIVVDLDDAGRKHGDKVARMLRGVAASIKIVLLPFSSEHPGKDFSDWLAAGGTPEQLGELIEQAPEASSGEDEPDAENASSRAKQSSILAELCSDVTLFHDHDFVEYGVIQVNGHREVWPVSSRSFEHLLVRRFFGAEGKPPSADAIKETRALFCARARYEGEQREVATRILRAGRNISISLADDQWRAIEITQCQWRIVAEASALFIKTPGMDPLPMPVGAGDLRELQELLRLDKEQSMLCVAWLLGALHPEGPYPILALHGEHGSAKSTRARALRRLVDPATPSLRTPPKDERDLIIAARNAHVIGIDNLSGIPPWLSDALCRLSTGGGFGTRKLYTDGEEILFDGKRPIILNGIAEDVCQAPDLADRAIVLALPPIRDEDRITEKEFWRQFEQIQPRIFGALLNAVAAAHANFKNTVISKPPRMADFALWICAAAEALPFTAQEFLEAYRLNRSEAILLALESSTVASAVLRLLEDGDIEDLTYTELLGKLNHNATETTKKAKAWPKNARALSGTLRRFAPALRAAGCFIQELARDPVTRIKRISIRKGRADSNRQAQPDPTEGSHLDPMVEEIL